MPRTPLVAIPARFSASASALRYRAADPRARCPRRSLRAGGEPLTVHPWAPGGAGRRPRRSDAASRSPTPSSCPAAATLARPVRRQPTRHEEVYDVDDEQDAFDLAVARWAIERGRPAPRGLPRHAGGQRRPSAATCEQHMDEPHRYRRARRCASTRARCSPRSWAAR